METKLNIETERERERLIRCDTEDGDRASPMLWDKHGRKQTVVSIKTESKKTYLVYRHRVSDLETDKQADTTETEGRQQM